MAVVCKSPQKSSEDLGIKSANVELIRRANHHLLYKEFDDCLEVCLKGIATAKDYPEHQGSKQTIEALCVLGTQAYAELNRWQEVLPFVTQLYDGIEDCPAKVVQLCVLLHAHMKDFTACGAIAHIWLRNPRNADNPEYTKLIDIFVTRVLQRQNRLTDVPAFLDSCPGISQERKDTYKRYAEIKEHERKSEEKSRQEAAEKPKTETLIAQSGKSAPDDAQGFLQKIGRSVSRFIPPVAWYLIKRIALISIFIYWIITRANFDLISNERLMGILSAVVRLWKSMFAPYYTTK